MGKRVLYILLLALCAACTDQNESSLPCVGTMCRMVNRSDYYAKVSMQQKFLKGLGIAGEWDMPVMTTDTLYDLQITLHTIRNDSIDPVPTKTFLHRQKFPSGVYYELSIENERVRANIIY